MPPALENTWSREHGNGALNTKISLSPVNDTYNVFNNMIGNLASSATSFDRMVAVCDSEESPRPVDNDKVGHINVLKATKHGCGSLPITCQPTIKSKRLILIDDPSQEDVSRFSSMQSKLPHSKLQKKSERKEALDKNIKKSTGGLVFHRRQSSGDIYTKLEQFDNGDISPRVCKVERNVQEIRSQSNLNLGRISTHYVVHGLGCWGDTDINSCFGKSTSASKISNFQAGISIPELPEYEVLPFGSTIAEDPSPGTTARGSTSGGVSGLKEWYKNRQLVSKATNKAEAPPKPKHLRKLVLSSWKSNARGGAGIVNLLSKRPFRSSPIVALKTLITIHKLLQQGPPDCRKVCSYKLSLLTDIVDCYKPRTGVIVTDPYSQTVFAYAAFLIEKISFHNKFPAYNSNYSVDFSAFTPTRPSIGDARCDPPRLDPLDHLQKIQDAALAALEEGFTLLGKKSAAIEGKVILASGRTMPVSAPGGASGFAGHGDHNPIDLVVSMLIPVLREADLVYDICRFLLSSVLSVREAGNRNPDCAINERIQKFDEHHKRLRTYFEQALSEAAITSSVTPPSLPLDPPRFIIPNECDEDLPSISLSGQATTTIRQACFQDALQDELERPKSDPLGGRERRGDRIVQRTPRPDSGEVDSDQRSQQRQTSMLSNGDHGQFLHPVSRPIVGGVGAAAAAAVQRFTAGQAEAKRVAAAAAEHANATNSQQAILRNIRLDPPPCALGFNSKLESRARARPQRPQHTRGVGRTWSSFDDETFFHQKLAANNPWSPSPCFVSPMFYSPRAPEVSNEVSVNGCFCKDKTFSSPLTRHEEFSEISHLPPDPHSPVPPATGTDERDITPTGEARSPTSSHLQQHQKMQDQSVEPNIISCPPNFSTLNAEGITGVKRPETPPMIEMDTPIEGRSIGQAADVQEGQVFIQHPLHHIASAPEISWQLGGSMSDSVAWNGADLCDPTVSGDRVVCCKNETPKDMPLAADWEIPPCELHLGPKIGQGAFGDVLRGTWQGTDVAVKRLQSSFGGGYYQATEEIRHEVAVIMRLRHPNIILFMGACTIPPEICIVMEFAANGSLFGVLHNPNIAMDMTTVVRWATEAARGMNYLHTRNPPVLHRDLKSVNLLVDADWHIKVSDFGLAMTKQSSYAHTQVGTWGWMAPEVLESGPYNEKADVYSFGVVLWELITREEPFKGHHPMQIMRAIDRGERPPIPESCPQLYRRLVTDCWHADPKCRPVFVEILIRLGDISNTLISLPESHRRTSSEHYNIQTTF